jgi:hypothetical protein
MLAFKLQLHCVKDVLKFETKQLFVNNKDVESFILLILLFTNPQVGFEVLNGHVAFTISIKFLFFAL